MYKNNKKKTTNIGNPDKGLFDNVVLKQNHFISIVYFLMHYDHS